MNIIIIYDGISSQNVVLHLHKFKSYLQITFSAIIRM